MNLDTSIWVGQKALADELGIPLQNVNNWIRRGKIVSVILPGSGIRLVNKKTISVKNQSVRKAKKNLQNNIE